MTTDKKDPGWRNQIQIRLWAMANGISTTGAPDGFMFPMLKKQIRDIAMANMEPGDMVTHSAEALVVTEQLARTIEFEVGVSSHRKFWFKYEVSEMDADDEEGKLVAVTESPIKPQVTETN